MFVYLVQLLRVRVSLGVILYYFCIVKLATIVEGYPKAPFSIGTTARCREGRYSFPWIAPLPSSTEKDIDTRLTKLWTAIDKLSIIWKSDLADKMKHSFFQAAVISILLYGCTIWTQTKRLEKKLDGNYARMLRAILNKSWRQNPTKHQLYSHLPPITKTIKVRWTRHAGHSRRSRDELISDVLQQIWPSKSRTTSTNIHTAALWGYRI